MMIDAGPNPVLVIESGYWSGKIGWSAAGWTPHRLRKSGIDLSAKRCSASIVQNGLKNDVNGNEKRACTGIMNMAPEWVSLYDVGLKK